MSKRKTVTEADRLAVPCPHCVAWVGSPCLDYNGRPKEFCLERGRPEVTRAKAQRKAEAINAKARAEYGPLFADLAEKELKPVTAADVLDARRRAAAFSAEEGGLIVTLGNNGLAWIEVRAIERHAATLIGVETARKIAAKLEETYPLGYIRGVWFEVLTRAKQVVFEYRRVLAPTSVGFRLEPGEFWPPEGQGPVMAAEEFHRMFPRLDHYKGLADAPEAESSEATFAAVRSLARAGGETQTQW